MRRIGSIMKDMGFNKDASVETQKAFIKHLIQAANQSQFQRKTETKPSVAPEPGEQLSFDSEVLGTDKKVS